MNESADKKVLPVDYWTARAIVEHAECEAAFGVDTWSPAGAFAADILPRPGAVPTQKSDIASHPPSQAMPVVAPSLGEAPKILAPSADEPMQATGPMPVPEPPSPSVSERLAAIDKEIAACHACGLAKIRTNVVPGQGNHRPRLMFVGEAPGETEDRTGLAFVGPAGELLTKMMKAIGFERDDVFIANVLKCRPPDNRPPEPNEVEKCLHFLERQLAIISPEVICALGAHAANNLLGRPDPVGRLRGRVFTYGRSQLVATYHPSYLMRMPEKKKDAWDDLKLVARLLGVTLPGAK